MGITIVPWMMNPGEEKIVAQRLKEVLETAQRSAHTRPARTPEELAADFHEDNPIDWWQPV